MPFENMVGTREYAVSQDFPLYPQCFLTQFIRDIALLRATMKMSSAIIFDLDQSKILLSGKVFTLFHSKRKMLDSSKLKEFADSIFKIDEYDP